MVITTPIIKNMEVFKKEALKAFKLPFSKLRSETGEILSETTWKLVTLVIFKSFTVQRKQLI